MKLHFLHKIVLLLLAIWLTNPAYTQVNRNAPSQNTSPEFTEIFKEVKLKLANNQEAEAIPLLEKLYKMDYKNANVQYLLGYCYVKLRTNIPDAVFLLEKASESYTKDYDPTSLKETRVSEYVYYYLIIAYSLNGQCEKTEQTLNKFYEVYSYFDEWYLVEGQKWVRECQKKKLAEDKTKIKKEKTDSTSQVEVNIEQVQEVDLGMNQPKVQDSSTTANGITETLAENNSTKADNTPEAKAKKQKNKRDKKDKIDTAKDSTLADSEAKMTTKAQFELENEKNALKKQEIEVRWKENFFELNETSNNTQKPNTPEFRDRLIQYNPETGKVVSKEVRYSTPSALYGVQVGAFLTPKYTSEFKNLKNVEVYVDQNGVFRYVIGRLIYKAQAEKLLQYVREMGYSDAFIVDINGGRYVNEVVTVNDQSLKKKFDTKVDFRVQVGAFRRELPSNIAQHYLLLEGIKEHLDGDLTTLTIGSFDNYNEAKNYAAKVKAIGVEDAFVVAFANEAKVGVEEAIKISELARANAEAEQQAKEKDAPFEKNSKTKKRKSSDL